jgi:hypothetical protein
MLTRGTFLLGGDMAKPKSDSMHTANCTKKGLWFENSQLKEVEEAIERIKKQTGLPVTFTSVVQKAVSDWLAKQK